MNQNQIQSVGEPNDFSEDIQSVNKQGKSGNKAQKTIFILVVGTLIVSTLVFFLQQKITHMKDEAKKSSQPKAQQDTQTVFNPEKSGANNSMPKLGAASGLPPPAAPAATSATNKVTLPNIDNELRPVRGKDGKVMTNADGKVLAIDKTGRIVEVPAISLADGDKPPLPGKGGGSAATGQTPAPQVATSQAAPVSRYGGALFVVTPSSQNTTPQAPTVSPAEAQAKQVADILRQVQQPNNQSSGFTNFTNPAVGAGQENTRPGTIANTLQASATPVAYAQRMPEQNLLLPKGRQADCILTGRIIDEVPGFTSCVLAQDLYSDNGKVLLLERGSELTGEYGVTNQLGLERLFVTWTRVKTPHGIFVDLQSPGSDRLGSSGLPGHLDNRWGARIGAAFLLSFVKDVSVAAINNQNKSSNGSTVTVSSGQNTLNASSALAEEVIKQTLKIKPRLTINEGDRISIYVARDLDFTRVYELRHTVRDVQK